MTPAIAITLALALLAQAKGDDAPARLEYMKESVTSLNVHPIDAPSAPFRPQAEPIFRLNNAVSGVKDGGIFLWLDEVGRPEAAIQVFLVPSGWWIHEFTSLSNAPLLAETGAVATWRPARPGVEFKAVPDAPRPADSAEGRLRQLRGIAADFAAEDHFETKAWNALRLLPKPLLRYGKAGNTVEDGALFAFVLGTDPEVFLMIEARAGKSGSEWQYALAPMTCYPVKATWKGKPTWSLPLRLPAEDPAATFFARQYTRIK